MILNSFMDKHEETRMRIKEVRSSRKKQKERGKLAYSAHKSHNIAEQHFITTWAGT